MNQKRVCQSLVNLDAWIRTWTDSVGGIHGYVIHHHQDCLSVLIPDTWAQSPILIAHSIMYEKTKAKKWLNRATLEATYLSNHYVKELHVYQGSSHEYKHESKPPLVGNALPTLALLEFASIIDKEQNSTFELIINVATDNIKNFCLKRQWDKKNKTFFGHFEAIPKTGRPHVHNMTAMAISALVAYAKITGKHHYVEEYAIPAGEHILSCQNLSGENTYGGYPYNDGRSSNLYHTLYHALTMRGILDLYEFTHDQEFLNSAYIAAKYIMNLIDGETQLFAHRVNKEKVIKYPQWVAASGAIVYPIKRLEQHGYHFDLQKTMDALLSQQHPHGGFPTFLGFADFYSPRLFPAEPKKKKWRDLLATPNWNSWIFELLSFLIDKGTDLPESTSEFPVELKCDGGKNSTPYIIYESREIVQFINPKTDGICFQLRKTDPVSQFGSVNDVRDKIRLEYRRHLYRKIIKILLIGGVLLLLTEALILTA